MEFRVREGIISGFKTNLGDKDGTNAPRVTVTANIPAVEKLDHVRVIVGDALAAVAEGIAATAECHTSGSE